MTSEALRDGPQPSTSVPSSGDILEIFDQLVSEEVIIYGPHDVIKQDYDGYPLEFRICPSLAKKPHTVGAPLKIGLDDDGKFGPGSDLYYVDKRLKLSRLNNSHTLALNLFSVDKPQFMILTTDSYRRQHEAMDQDDFVAALQVLNALDDIYVIYNCTEVAGCSRSHKHMQGLKGPPTAFELFIHGDEQETRIPFKHFSHHFKEAFGATHAQDVFTVYKTLLGRAKEALGVSEDDDLCPHNVVLWKDRMIVIPRRAAALGRASGNAAGMLGSIWVPDQSVVDEWMRFGCGNVMRHLGVPQ
ncbi:hypothetical protein BCR34DRAFT_607161 [Clohesyomyces aquaticus]|uniref:Uncharacterized protein n=1 Tax=Clohesyomyces aquaticus TaxID=1231657 RepID=A0A1Y1YIH6_9PLEO|nr:hypothetical protein BCR34DRAFT_607161 [Clohesyomyces aquaticus]